MIIVSLPISVVTHESEINQLNKLIQYRHNLYQNNLLNDEEDKQLAAGVARRRFLDIFDSIETS